MVGFGVGVIGTGYWGRKIVDEYSKMEGVKIVGISDLEQENLDFCSEKYGVSEGFKDFNELLSLEELQAVNVCTPNSSHYKICRTALEMDKHVLVEKPITLTSAEGWDLVKLAQEKRLTLSVGHIFRFNNVLSEIRRLIAEKFFGDPFLMEMTWANLERPWPDRDVLVDLAPHMFDIQNYLLDKWPKEITCCGGFFRRNSGEETAYVVSSFDEGPMAMANISWLVPRKTREILLVGETRSALIDAVAQEATIHESGYTYKLGIERNNTIRDELLHFIESVPNPETETRNSGTVGVRTIELIEAAKLSMTEKRSVSLTNLDTPFL
ncbi:MAG: Gfo/Idh/MocA family oxidoreductase [Methanobacteriota archaeon]|nr:MAG: Gfo/Idh/MocA family oxidoreductase [Euryarchaeota archaeon]